MQPRFTPLRVLVCVVCFLMLTASRAAADTLTLDFVSTVPGVNNVAFSFNGNADLATPGPYFWNTTPPPNAGSNPVGMFCIELTEGIPGSSFDFEVVAPINATTIATGTAAENQARVDAITALYGYYYNSVWNKPDTAMQDPSFHSFQLALWELVYDGAGSSADRFTTGVLRSDDPYAAGAQTMLDTVLGNVAGGVSQFATLYKGYELVALLNDGVQDQLYLRPKAQVTQVPAPSAALLAGIGLLALFGRARWNRRTPSPA